MRHEVPHIDSKRYLIEILKNSLNGDVVVCHSISMIDFGERALKRMRPDKKLTFVLGDEAP